MSAFKTDLPASEPAFKVSYENPQGRLGIGDAAEAVKEVCDTAREMLEQIKATAWWKAITNLK